MYRPKVKPKVKKNTISHSIKVSVESEAVRTVEELGYECVQAAFVREPDRLVFRVFIDSVGGINVRDCERVSKKISRMLDELFGEDIEEHYTLEVGSPGVERPLLKPDDYARFAGSMVRLKLSSKKIVVGKIKELDETRENITVEVDDSAQKEQKIQLADVSRANLVWNHEKEEF